jgi:hypothetical protein
MTRIEKTFFFLAGVFALTSGISIYQMATALTAYKSAESAQEAYHVISSTLTFGVPAALLVLLVFAGVAFWKTEKGRYFVFAFLFFSVFTIIDYVYIGELYFHFTKNNGLWKGGFSVMGLAGLFLCFCALIITVVVYLVLNTFKKMLSPKTIPPKK